YRLPDPLAVFYAPRGAGVDDRHLRASVVLAKPEELPEVPMLDLGMAAAYSSAVVVSAGPPPPQRAMRAGPRAAAAMEVNAPETPIALRTDFRALALFAARVPTDASGRAQVPVTVPDSLTRYRVMAVAAAGARSFGAGESTLTARLPLMVRPSPPRFLNFGDRIELPVVVQNQTEAPLAVEVAV